MLSKYKFYSSFSVKDLAQARKFYEEILGLEIVDEFDGGFVILGMGAQRHMVYQKDNHEPATYTALNFEVDNLEDVIEKLNQLGVNMEQYNDMGEFSTNEKGISKSEEGRMAWFKDPSGNVIGLMSGF